MKKLFSILILLFLNIFAFQKVNYFDTKDNTTNQSLQIISEDLYVESATITQTEITDTQNDDSFLINWTISSDVTVNSMTVTVYNETSNSIETTKNLTQQQIDNGEILIEDDIDIDVLFNTSYSAFFTVNGTKQLIETDTVYIHSGNQDDYITNVYVQPVEGKGNDDILVTYTLVNDLPQTAITQIYIDNKSFETDGNDYIQTFNYTSKDLNGNYLNDKGQHTIEVSNLYETSDYVVYFYVSESGLIENKVMQDGHSRVFNISEEISSDNGGETDKQINSWVFWLLISMMSVTLLAFVWWGVDWYRNKKLMPEIEKEIKAVENKPEEMIVKSNEWLESIKQKESATSNTENTLENKDNQNKESN